MKSSEVKEMLLETRENPVLSKENAVSTGSTLLNLACTDNPDLGFLKGSYIYYVGDSTTGKTWLTLTCFAEASKNPAFKNYRLIFDDVEGGALMDMELYFGKDVAKRIEPPARYKNGDPKFSDTVQSFYYHMADIIEKGKPFIYVLDSQDALTSDQSEDKFKEQKKADEEGKDSAGSYGDGKAKYHSEHLRQILSGIRKTKSILIIIGQTRDNLGMGFSEKTRAGGRALRFYANIEIWLSIAGQINKSVMGKSRTVGVRTLAQVKKNRITGKIGKDRSVTIPIYQGLGIDDTGACVDFLIENEQWPEATGEKVEKKAKKVIYDTGDLMIVGTREQIIQQIEEDNLEGKLRKLTAQVWKEIEDACTPKRKRRYE